jgi:hypothetical protein
MLLLLHSAFRIPHWGGVRFLLRRGGELGLDNVLLYEPGER